MPIVPDTKNWTWVLEAPCPQCGFDASSFAATDVPAMIRANAAAWPAVLQRAGVAVRPDDSTWSALEYACHVRDVFRIFDTRVHLMLDEHDPSFANWDQDVTAVEERYSEQDPAVVSGELQSAALTIADLFGTIQGDRWHRKGFRGDGAEFTVESIAKYFIHDPVHHLWDVTHDQGH
ncbi:MAG: DinB family protein [Actinomycetota bacterium]